MVMASDKDAIAVALKTCNEINKANARIVRIKNSLHVDEIYISKAHLDEAERDPDLEIISGPHPWPFDSNGNMW